jgi:transposase-like protein
MACPSYRPHECVYPNPKPMIKAGFNQVGTQRYKCPTCGKYFVLYPKSGKRRFW